MSHATTLAGAAPVLNPRHDTRTESVRHERRAEQRYTLLIRTAKVVGPTGEWLCIVRDASTQGIRLKTFHPLPSDSAFELELANGERHEIIRMWEEGDLVGFRFARPVDFDRLVAQAPPHLRKRELHLNFIVPLVVSARSGECDGHFRDISQHGARIECGLHLALQEHIRLDSETFPPIAATVCWRRAPYYGVVFDRVFPFDELARQCGVVPRPREEAAAPDRA